MKTKIITVLVIVLLFITHCGERCNNDFKIKNDSNHLIDCYLREDSTISNKSIYDYLHDYYIERLKNQEFARRNVILPQKERVVESIMGKWRDVFKRIQGGRVYLYVLDVNAIHLHQSDVLDSTIIEKVALKRYSFTYDDLEKLNWKVVYQE